MHNGGCRFGILIVSEHNSLALDKDLSLAVFVRIIDFDLVADDGFSGRTHSRIKVRRKSCYRRGLCKPVSLEESNSYIFKPSAHLWIYRRGGRYDDSQPASQVIVNVFKYLALDVDSQIL